MFLSDDVEKVDNVADMMTSSTYPQGVVSKNGGEGHMNGGATNGSGSLDCAGAVADSTNVTIADTSLKCLEEPSFEFEASKETVAKKSEAVVKKPSYRVLEDPYEVTAGSASAPPKPKASPNYRVLEDPMTTAMYDPSTSSEAAATAMMSNRPLASEVLEGAREKFDKFWGSKTRPANPDSATNEP